MNTPITIDADNTVWTLHRAGVAPQEIGVSQNGVPHDISNNDVWFRTESGLMIKAQPAEKPGCVAIHFQLSDIDAIPLRGTQFMVIDNTDQRIYADGKIFVRGFR